MIHLTGQVALVSQPATARGELIASLPMLCQLRATPDVLIAARTALQGLIAVASDSVQVVALAGLIATAGHKVNERIAPKPANLDKVLGHPWVSDVLADEAPTPAVTIHMASSASPR